MKDFELRYRPYNDHALLIQWPSEIDTAVLMDLLSFRSIILKTFPEFSLTSAYCEIMIRSREPFRDFIGMIKNLKDLYHHRDGVEIHRNRIRIPVCYDTVFGLDQEELCMDLNISPEELIKLHTSSIYTVYAIGFLPGFMYLGGLSEALFHSRKEHPRREVPEGAVGIAGMQTGIYPQSSPGGWQLIGNCPVKLFDVKKQPPVIAAVGDEIEFFAIGYSEYELYRLQEAAGIFQLDKQLIT